MAYRGTVKERQAGTFGFRRVKLARLGHEKCVVYLIVVGTASENYLESVSCGVPRDTVKTHRTDFS